MEFNINQPLLQESENGEELLNNREANISNSSNTTSSLNQLQEKRVSSEIIDIESFGDITFTDCWFHVMYLNEKELSLYYKKGILSSSFIKLPASWKVATITEPKKKVFQVLVQRRNDGGVIFSHSSSIQILQYEEIHDNVMIEYDGNGNKVYMGECNSGDYDGCKRHGYGKQYKKNEIVYEGYWSLNKREGKGKSYSNGVIRYDGNWKDNVPNGMGKLYNHEGNLTIHDEWKNGYTKLNDMYYCYQKRQVMNHPTLIWIWMEVIIGFLFILAPMILSIHTEDTGSLYSIFLVISVYYLIIAFLHQFESQVCWMCIAILLFFYTSFLSKKFIEDIPTLYKIFSVDYFKGILFIIMNILSLFILISSSVIFYSQYNYSFPFSVNMFSCIHKKKGWFFIYCEFYLGIRQIVQTYYCYWGYTWKAPYHAEFDLRLYGLFMIIMGIMPFVVACLQSYDNPIFSIGTGIGIIWGAISFFLSFYYVFYLSDLQNDPKYCNPYECIIVSNHFQFFVFFSALLIIISFAMYYMNRDDSLEQNDSISD